MRVLVLHNEVLAGAPAHENDVLVQERAVDEALRRRGHDTDSWGVGLDLGGLRRRLEETRPEVVFNLVESLGGSDRLIALVPRLLETLSIPYTGSSAANLLATSDKVTAKNRLTANGIRTPRTAAVWPPSGNEVGDSVRVAFRTLVKSRTEHGSLALDDDMLQPPNRDLLPVLRSNAARLGGSCLAEEYVEGREFNLSLICGELKQVASSGAALDDSQPRADKNASDRAPLCLPPAEILFSGLPPGRIHIVGYEAKWEEQSLAFNSTPRCFEFPANDDSLLERLRAQAFRVWEAFSLSGFARVDFRVDRGGEIYVLEANGNPCLSPDAGFAAALERAGVSFDEAIEALVQNATHGVVRSAAADPHALLVAG